MSNVIKFTPAAKDRARFVMGYDKDKSIPFPFTVGLVAYPDTDKSTYVSGKLNIGMLNGLIDHLIGMRDEYNET